MHPLENDVDPEGSALTLTQINGTPIQLGVPVAVEGGSVVLLDNGALRFTPATNFNGTPSFHYTVVDSGGLAQVGTVHLDVTPRSTTRRSPRTRASRPTRTNRSAAICAVA
ncbi:MAG: Ig-like domain-containing protein [Sphingomonas sp.]